ncbi:MAG: FxLYD domain-containing protein, partial [Bacilli bacterium]|nr:FxLYD domain-containing protein [Bacilli bacterium]
ATAGMVLGIIGVVLSFIPIINNIAFFIGILALIFGIIGIVKKAGKGKAIAGIVLGILSIAITLAMQSAVSDSIDETSKELDKITGNSTEEVLKTEVNVTLGDLQISKDEYGLTDSKMVVTVKNITDKKKSYSLHIEAVDANGNRIHEDYVYANDLSAGQTQNFEIFTYIEDSKIDAMKAATFNIIEASAY